MSTADIKKHWHRKLSHSKDWFWGDPRGGDTAKLRQNICILKILVFQISTDSKKHWHPSLSHLKNCFLEDPFGSEHQRGGTPKLCQNICL